MKDEIFLQGLDNRHPSTIHMIGQLQPNPNLSGDQAIIVITREIWSIAKIFTSNIGDSPELTAGLRKLLEAKDCFVRASLDLRPVYYTDR